MSTYNGAIRLKIRYIENETKNLAGSKVEFSSSGKNIPMRGNRIQMQEVWFAFVPIVLSIHIWSILHVLEEVPAWILRLSVWELIGTIAYTQVFAMIESLFVLIFFLVVSFFLPKRWFANQFVPATSLVILVVTAWAIVAHNFDQVIRTWGVREFLLWLMMVMLSLVLALVLVSRAEKVKNILSSLVKRVAVLSAVYLFIDGLSVIIVLVRNI